VRPAAAVCSFHELGQGPAGAYLQIARHFGEGNVRDIFNFPHLLREWSRPDRDWTTFDGRGKYEPVQIELDGSRWKEFPSFRLGQPSFISLQSGRWELATRNERPWPNDILITLNHACSTQKSGIPAFWKVIEVKRTLPQSRPYAVERIRAIVREDHFMGGILAGHMQYEYMAATGTTNPHGHKVVTATAGFDIYYSDAAGWVAEPLLGDSPGLNRMSPCIRPELRELGLLSQEYPVEEVMQTLVPVICRLLKAGKVSLHQVLGRPLFDSPPQMLLNLVA
jgi:hypothetical protein